VRRLLNWLVLLPLAILLVLFAIANRNGVILSFDPFEGKESPLTISLPLFIVIFAALIFGILIGWLISLARQWRLWRAARAAENELARTKAELESLRRPEPPRPELPSLPFSG
jgi:uncharacterized integral membrane protein